ncbi:unnamed protein product [Diplocarpon coronariae]|nr:hypothetical protein JHW43_005653 [Diplocarpon mali]
MASSQAGLLSGPARLRPGPVRARLERRCLLRGEDPRWGGGQDSDDATPDQSRSERILGRAGSPGILDEPEICVSASTHRAPRAPLNAILAMLRRPRRGRLGIASPLAVFSDWTSNRGWERVRTRDCVTFNIPQHIWWRIKTRIL